MSLAVKTELSKLTVAKLRSFARELQIEGRRKMTKAELVETLSGAPGVERFVTTSSAASERRDSRKRDSRTRKSRTRKVEAVSSSRIMAKGEAEPVERSRVDARRAESHGATPPPAGAPAGGSGSLGLLVVDPTTVFVFWDVEEDMIARARDYVGDPQGALVLRTYGVAGAEIPGSSVRGRFDLFVDSAKGEQYLQVSNPGQSMTCELGIEARDGGFHVFAWSNRLDLPADRQSPTREIRRMRIGGDQSRHWLARGAIEPWRPEPTVVAAEAALPTDQEEIASASVPAEPVTSDTVMPPEELAALFESMEFKISPSSVEAARGVRSGLFSGVLGVKLKDRLERPAGHIPDGSRLKISLPGLIAPGSRTD